MALPVLTIVIAASVYAVNALFGASVKLHWIDSRSFRWLHHGLYALTFAATVVAVSSLVWSSSSAGWFLLPAVVPLALLPYIGSAHRHPRKHILVALAPLPFYIGALAVGLVFSAGG